MSEYDFWISYIKGKENVVANALSRKTSIFSLIPLKVDLKDRVLGKLVGYSWHLKVVLALQNGR